MLAKNWRLSTDQDALILRLNLQANFPEQRSVQAGPLIGYIAFHSLPDGSISGLLQKRATANSFTRASCYLWRSKGHTSTTVWLKIRSIPHVLQSPAVDKEPQSNAKMHTYVNQMAWRDSANLKAHITSRAFPCETPVRGRYFFWNAVFNHFPLEHFSQTDGNQLIGWTTYNSWLAFWHFKKINWPKARRKDVQKVWSDISLYYTINRADRRRSCRWYTIHSIGNQLVGAPRACFHQKLKIDKYPELLLLMV